jgi:hypothetical protein
MKHLDFIPAIFLVLASVSSAAAQTPSLGAPALTLTPRVQMMTVKPVSLGVFAHNAPARVSMAMEVRSRFGNPNQKPRLLQEVVPVSLGQKTMSAIKR